MGKQLRSNLLILIAAFIWGTAFLAQKEGAHIGAFTFNGLRFLIGGTFLLPVIWVIDRFRAKTGSGDTDDGGRISAPGPQESDDLAPEKEEAWSISETAPSEPKKDPVDLGWNSTVLTGGVILGLILFVATSCQQYGMPYTTLRNAGFITALYSVMVPVASIAFGKHVSKLTWLGVVLGVIGLYCLSMAGESLRLSFGDTFMLLAAIGFAAQIMVIDHFSPLVDPVKLSCTEFFTVGIISLAAMFIFESPDINEIMSEIGPLLYAGLLSSGVAYTLQIVGQRGANPTQASLIMCLESVFSMLTGMIVLHEKSTPVELLGAVMIFTAVVLAQIPDTGPAGQKEPGIGPAGQKELGKGPAGQKEPDQDK